jgi:hypothetical protein
LIPFIQVTVQFLGNDIGYACGINFEKSGLLQIVKLNEPLRCSKQTGSSRFQRAFTSSLDPAVFTIHFLSLLVHIIGQATFGYPLDFASCGDASKQGRNDTCGIAVLRKEVGGFNC